MTLLPLLQLLLLPTTVNTSVPIGDWTVVDLETLQILTAAVEAAETPETVGDAAAGVRIGRITTCWTEVG